MELTIVSPYAKKTYLITWVEVNTPEGNFVFQPGHAPIILSLSAKRPVTFGLQSGKRESIMMQQGVISVSAHHATIITSQQI